MLSKPYVLYAWPLSLYSGKIRAYLRYKGIPYVEKPIHLWTFSKLKKHTGVKVMPVVMTPQGAWLQDSSHIIDALEARFTQNPVMPSTPRQRIAALLLEAWGDEFWLPSAMHYRWSYPENFRDLFQPEGGDLLLPFAPRALKNLVIGKAAGLMRSYLDLLGVVDAQKPLIEAWTTRLCDALDAHFAVHPYLLGNRPCYGDFGLFGPLYAHLGRDPYPARTLIAVRPHLQQWLQRMQQPEPPPGAEFCPNDQIPETLNPIFDSIFEEFWPQIAATWAQMQAQSVQVPAGQCFARGMETVNIRLNNQPFRRVATPYSVWMAQRALDAYAELLPHERTEVTSWLGHVGGLDAMALSLHPRIGRKGLKVFFERSA